MPIKQLFIVEKIKFLISNILTKKEIVQVVEEDSYPWVFKALAASAILNVIFFVVALLWYFIFSGHNGYFQLFMISK